MSVTWGPTTSNWNLKGGAVLWDRALNLWSLCYILQLVPELNSTAGCSAGIGELACMGKTSHLVIRSIVSKGKQCGFAIDIYFHSYFLIFQYYHVLSTFISETEYCSSISICFSRANLCLSLLCSMPWEDDPHRLDHQSPLELCLEFIFCQ